MDKLKTYKHIFFDLDHTLWDYEKNSSESLLELFTKYNLAERGITSADEFLTTFEAVNSELWSQFNKNKINRTTIRTDRFKNILGAYKISDTSLSNQLSEEYLMLCPTKPHVFPYTFEVLDYLREKYVLHILTNGFNDVQFIKLKHAQLSKYFTSVVTSDSAGYKKPMASIFKYAIDKAEANKAESIMIGDNLQTDIMGARNFGLDQIYFNPLRRTHQASITHEIACLSELKNIL